MDILISGDEDPHSTDFVRWAEETLRAENIAEASEVGITIVSPERMAQLNADYRGRTGPTDVLSLPLFANAAEIKEEAAALPPGEPLLLGDIIICPSVAAENAAADGIALAQELRHLTVHGVLHLLGYDHEGESAEEAAEATRMRERERSILAAALERPAAPATPVGTATPAAPAVGPDA